MIDKEKTLLGFVRESNFNELNLNIEQDHGLTQFRFSDVPNKSRQAHASLCHVIISRSSNKNIYRPNCINSLHTVIAFGVETLEEGLIKLIKNIRTIDCQSLNLYDKVPYRTQHSAAITSCTTQLCLAMSICLANFINRRCLINLAEKLH
jgi:hypothetical protein